MTESPQLVSLVVGGRSGLILSISSWNSALQAPIVIRVGSQYKSGMAMRYIIRRSNPEDLTSLRKDLPQLDAQLEKAGDGLRRTIPITINNMDRINYLLVTKKSGSNWSWVCPSIELISESEQGLFKLMERFSMQPPAHLAHLKK